MIGKLVYKLVKIFFKDYVEGIDRDKFDFGIWSGKLTLEKLKLK